MSTNESTYDDTTRKAYLSSGEVIHQFHSSAMCAAEHCPVHNPSEHALRDYPLSFNFDAFVFERLVPMESNGYVVGIPDPDDYTLNKNGGTLVYRNSARCLKCNRQIVSRRRYDDATCDCGELTVSGGHEKMIRETLSGLEDTWEETSIVFADGKFE